MPDADEAEGQEPPRKKSKKEGPLPNANPNSVDGNGSSDAPATFLRPADNPPTITLDWSDVPTKVDKVDYVRRLTPDQLALPHPAVWQRDEDEEAAFGGDRVAPPSSVWRVGWPEEAGVRMREHPRAYHERQLAEAATAVAAVAREPEAKPEQAKGKGKEKGKGKALLPAGPGTGTGPGEKEGPPAVEGGGRRTRAARAAVVAPADEPSKKKGKGKGKEKEKGKGKEAERAASATPAQEEGVRYAGYVWRRARVGEELVWEGT